MTVMHVRWKRKQHRTNRQVGESICPHSKIQKPWTVAPVLMDYRDKKYRYAWRIGPGIRECCLNLEQAQAAWWWEVECRFLDLHEDYSGLAPELITAILEQQNIIEQFLELRVPRPSKKAQREYLKFRALHGLVRRESSPPFFSLLQVQWPCSEEEIKAAWRRLALEHHPDRGGSQSEFIRIKTAYEAAIQYAASHG